MSGLSGVGQDDRQAARPLVTRWSNPALRLLRMGGDRGRRWRRAITPLGSLLTMAILAWLIRKGGHSYATELASGVGRWLFVATVVLAVVGWAMMTLKWKFALRSLGVRSPFARLFAFNLTAQLWNLVLPGMMGGEIYRGGRLVSDQSSLVKVATAAILDRGTTVMAIALVGLLGLAGTGGGGAGVALLIGLGAVALVPCAGYALLRFPSAQQAIRRLVAVAIPGPRARTVEDVISWVSSRPRPLLALLGLAIACQVVLTLDWAVLARAFGVGVGVTRIAWILAASSLLPFLVPLPGVGVAVQQGVFASLLVLTGTPPGQASAVAISGPLVAVLLGLLGVAMDGASAVTNRLHDRRDVDGRTVSKEGVCDYSIS